MVVVSAGLIMYRTRGGLPEVLLGHPGGPFWKNKDDGAWSIPKGEADNRERGEELLNVAKREFTEETGFAAPDSCTYLTSVKRSDGKIVEAWICEGDVDVTQARSNTILIDWPPRSGKKMEIPEIDRVEFFDIETAKKKITAYQLGIVEALEEWFGREGRNSDLVY